MRVIVGSQRTNDSDTFLDGCRGKGRKGFFVCTEERNNFISLIDIFFLMIIILEYFSPTTGQLRVTVEIELQRSGKPKFLHH